VAAAVALTIELERLLAALAVLVAAERVGLL
jgi:hypothetical protein